MKVTWLLAFAYFLSIASTQAQEVVDSIKFNAKDSALPMPTDPTTDFFQQGEKIKATDKVSLIMLNKKATKLAAFLKSPDMQFADHVLSDLDNDGRKELLISNFTGGAHCCDEIYVFKNSTATKYQQVAKLFAGQTLITRGNEFIYSFGEHLGYFFTCYACGYSDTSDAAPIEVRSIALHYSKGKMFVVPGTTELRSIINDNLGKLGELPYEELEEDVAQDNGLRKEFAMNLAVFYYSFGRNLTATQALFNKYYKYPDAIKVWQAFTKQLQYIRKANVF